MLQGAFPLSETIPLQSGLPQEGDNARKKIMRISHTATLYTK